MSEIQINGSVPVRVVARVYGTGISRREFSGCSGPQQALVRWSFCRAALS